MYGDHCPKCGYTSHDENGTDYHNNCLQDVHKEEVRLFAGFGFLAGVILAFVFRRKTG